MAGRRVGVLTSPLHFFCLGFRFVHPSPKEAFPYLQTKTHNDPRDPTSQRVSVFWSKRRGGGGGGKKRKRQESDGPESGGTTRYWVTLRWTLLLCVACCPGKTPVVCEHVCVGMYVWWTGCALLAVNTASSSVSRARRWRSGSKRTAVIVIFVVNTSLPPL